MAKYNQDKYGYAQYGKQVFPIGTYGSSSYGKAQYGQGSAPAPVINPPQSGMAPTS